MFKSTVRIEKDTDVAEALEEFRRECTDSGILQYASVIDEVDRTVRDLAFRGGELVRIGSNMHVIRTIDGEGYRIRVIADFTQGKKSILSRLRSGLGLT